MAKKSKKSLFGKIGAFLMFLMGALVCVSMVFPALTKAVEGSDPINRFGYEVAFGKTLVDGGLGNLVSGKTTINFSILPVLAYLLPVIVTLLMGLLVKNRKVTGFVCFLVFVAAAVLIFLMPSITSATVTAEVLGQATTTTSTYADLGYALGYGSIIGGVLSIIGALLSGAYAIVK